RMIVSPGWAELSAACRSPPAGTLLLPGRRRICRVEENERSLRRLSGEGRRRAEQGERDNRTENKLQRSQQGGLPFWRRPPGPRLGPASSLRSQVQYGCHAAIRRSDSPTSTRHK